MKKILFALLSLVAISCGDDDSGPKKPVVTRVEITEVDPITITYNRNRTIKSIGLEDFNHFEFEYSGTKISAITKTDGENPGEYRFSYQGQTIVSYEYEGQVFTPVYNQPQNILNNGIILDDEGEITNFKGEGTAYSITYDRSKKGSLYNANQVILPLMLIDDLAYIFTNFLSKYPVAQLSGGEETTIDNQFGEEGYLESSNFTYAFYDLDVIYIYENR